MAQKPASPKTAQQTPASKPAPKSRQAAAAPSGDANLPGVLQFSYTLSRLVIVIVALAVAVVSAVSGAAPVDIAVRTACALLAVGFLLWFANMRLARSTFDALAEDLKAQQEAAAGDGGAISTREEKV